MTIAQTAVDDLETCTVPNDAGGETTFRGRLLGQASTHEDGKLRWFEIRIIKNAADNTYVVSKIGKSVVYHLPDCDSLRLPEAERVTVTDPPDGWLGCPVCLPHTSDESVVLERDRITLREGLYAFEVLEALRQRNDATGEWFLSMTARHALRDAIEKDAELMRAYARDSLTRGSS